MTNHDCHMHLFCDSFFLIVLANEITIHNEKTIFSSPAEILDSTEHASMFPGLLESEKWRQYFKVT